MATVVAAPLEPAPPAPPAPVVAAPPIAAAPPKPVEPPPAATPEPLPPPPPIRDPFANAVPAPTGGIPGWLIGIGFGLALAGALYLLYNYVLPKRGAPTAAGVVTATTAPVSALPGAPAKKAHPYAKFLEVTGVRFNEDAKQKATVQFIVVNHSAADLPELKMQIMVQASGKPLFDFPFTVSSVGPFESKEFTAPVQTSLKGYEVPDWQFVKAEFEITSQP